jgi:hypothetical protein
MKYSLRCLMIVAILSPPLLAAVMSYLRANTEPWDELDHCNIFITGHP